MRHFIVKLNGKVIDLGPRLYDVVQSDGNNSQSGCKYYYRYITYLKETFIIRGEKPDNTKSCINQGINYTGRDESYYNTLISSGEWYYYKGPGSVQIFERP